MGLKWRFWGGGKKDRWVGDNVEGMGWRRGERGREGERVMEYWVVVGYWGEEEGEIDG